MEDQRPKLIDGHLCMGDKYICPSSVKGQRKVCKPGLQICIHSLEHTCQCSNAKCRSPGCKKTKKVIQHRKICKRKRNEGCSVCKKLIQLCYFHARRCCTQKCSVLFCLNIKYKLKHQKFLSVSKLAQKIKRQLLVSARKKLVPDSGMTRKLVQAGFKIGLAREQLDGDQPVQTTSNSKTKKMKLMQSMKQLMLLAHACRCKMQVSRGDSKQLQCAVPHCKTMKVVLNHMPTCQEGKYCTVPLCSSSRQIVTKCSRPNSRLYSLLKLKRPKFDFNKIFLEWNNGMAKANHF